MEYVLGSSQDKTKLDAQKKERTEIVKIVIIINLQDHGDTFVGLSICSDVQEANSDKKTKGCSLWNTSNRDSGCSFSRAGILDRLELKRILI